MSEPDHLLTVTLGSSKVPAESVFEIVVDQDLDQPDMASVVVSNVRGEWSAKAKLGDAVEIQAAGKAIFKGELTGIEPVYDHSVAARCTLRALNRLHRL